MPGCKEYIGKVIEPHEGWLTQAAKHKKVGAISIKPPKGPKEKPTVKKSPAAVVALAEAIAKARAAGFGVQQSDNRTLLLDLDAPASGPRAMKLICELREQLGIKGCTQWESKGGNVHMRLRLSRGMIFPARVAIQAALGSDPKREVRSILEWMGGAREPSLLFVPKGLKKVKNVNIGVPLAGKRRRGSGRRRRSD